MLQQMGQHGPPGFPQRPDPPQQRQFQPRSDPNVSPGQTEDYQRIKTENKSLRLKVAKLEGIVETHSSTKHDQDQMITKLRDREIEYKNQMVLLNYQTMSFQTEIDAMNAKISKLKASNLQMQKSQKNEDDTDWGALYCHQELSANKSDRKKS
jgi:hypothetical protein